MYVRTLGLAWVAALLLSCAAGCNQSSSDAASGSSSASSVETIAQFHWLGKERIARDTNAACLMKIWRERESVRLEAQTLDKLAAFLITPNLAAGSSEVSVPTNGAVSSQQSFNIVRPLLEDILAKESYLEIRQSDTNSPPEITFAIRLEGPRAGLWQTNLAKVLETRTGMRPVATPSGWELMIGTHPSTAGTQHSVFSASRIRLAYLRGWTLLTFSPKDASSTNSEAAISVITHASSTTNWLEADFDLRRLATALDSDCMLLQGFPALSLTVCGDGQNVLTRGELRFPRPLPAMLEPWSVPTNLIGKQVIGFTGARGLAPLFKSCRVFSGLNPRAVPTQIYTWDEFGAPFHLYFALAVEDARALVNKLAAPLPGVINPRLAQNCGSVSVDTNVASLTWDGLHYCSPFLNAYTNTHPQFLAGGFGPYLASPTSRMPVELINHLLQGTNLVYYDFELTGERVVHYRYLDDAYRVLFDAHGPRLGKTASLDWIAANLTNLLFAATEVRVDGPARMNMARKSSVGLTAPEIELMANWLELPEFPRGLCTLLQTNGVPVQKAKMLQFLERQRRGTNAVPPKGE